MNIKKYLSIFFQILITTVFLQISSVYSQEKNLTQSYVSIKQLVVLENKEKLETVCAGVVFDEKRKLAVTAWHCIPNQESLIGKSGVFFVEKTNIKLLGYLPEADMAIFQLENLNGLKAPSFKNPNKGEVLNSSAFFEELPVLFNMKDRSMPFLSIEVILDWEGKTVFSGLASLSEENGNFKKTNFKWIVAQDISTATVGFSGAGVFDKHGNLVGIFSSMNKGFTNISSIENAFTFAANLK